MAYRTELHLKMLSAMAILIEISWYVNKNLLDRRRVVKLTYERVIEYCKKEDLTISAFERFCKLGNGTVHRWKNKSY